MPMPPSTGSPMPVINLAASEHMNTTAAELRRQLQPLGQTITTTDDRLVLAPSTEHISTEDWETLSQHLTEIDTATAEVLELAIRGRMPDRRLTALTA